LCELKVLTKYVIRTMCVGRGRLRTLHLRYRAMFALVILVDCKFATRFVHNF